MGVYDTPSSQFGSLDPEAFKQILSAPVEPYTPPPPPPPEETGYIAGTGKSLLRGIANIPVQGGHAMEYNEDYLRDEARDESKLSMVNKLGRGIADISEKVRDSIAPAEFGSNETKRSVFQGVEALPVSAAYAVPSIAGGIMGGALGVVDSAGVASLPQAIAGAVTGQALTAPIMFRAQAQDTAEELDKIKSSGKLPDLTNDKIVDVAKKAGHAEWMGESLSNIPEALIFSRIPGLRTVVKSARDVLTPGLKQFAKTYAQTWLAEQAGEGYTAGRQAQAMNEVLPHDMQQTPWQAIKEQAGPTTVMSLLMAGGGHGLQYYRGANIAKKLEDPAVPPDERLKAAATVAELIKDTPGGSASAQNFMVAAFDAIGDESVTGSAPYALDLNNTALLEPFSPVQAPGTSSGESAAAPAGQVVGPARPGASAGTSMLNDSNPMEDIPDSSSPAAGQQPFTLPGYNPQVQQSTTTSPGTLVNALTAGGISTTPQLEYTPIPQAATYSTAQRQGITGPIIDAEFSPVYPALPAPPSDMEKARTWAQEQIQSGKTYLMQNRGVSNEQHDARILAEYKKAQGDRNDLSQVREEASPKKSVSSVRGGNVTALAPKTVAAVDAAPAFTTPQLQQIHTTISALQPGYVLEHLAKNPDVVRHLVDSKVVEPPTSLVKQTQQAIAWSKSVSNIAPVETHSNASLPKPAPVKSSTLARRALDTGKDSLHLAVAKLGGISRADIDKQTGNGKDLAVTLNKLATREGKAGRMHVISTKGKPLDTVRESLVENGYLPEGATINDLLDRLDGASRGVVHRSNQVSGAAAESEYDDQLARYQSMLESMTDEEHDEFHRNQWLDEQAEALTYANDVLDELIDSLDGAEMTAADWQAVEDQFMEALNGEISDNRAGSGTADQREVQRHAAETETGVPQQSPDIVAGEDTSGPGKESLNGDIPSHIVNAVDNPREVMTAVSLATKQQTKDTLNENLKSGGIPHSNPIRLTTVEELHDIISTGKLREGKDYEGRSGISAQLVDGKKPIVAYGPNDKISAAIIFPESSNVGKGQSTNEVKVDARTDVKDLRFVVDGFKAVMGFDELREAVGEKRKESNDEQIIQAESVPGLPQVRQDLQKPRELPVVPEKPAVQASESTGSGTRKNEGGMSDSQPRETAQVTPLDQAAHEAATSPTNETPEPTQAQIEAGNYKKGHVDFQGLDISIENPAGSKRKGVDPNGKAWETELYHHYGYIKGTIGRDKDHIDVFIGDNHDSSKVFVVDQIDPDTGKFDEHKVMLGFDTLSTARTGYLKNYDKSGPQRIGAITETSLEKFKRWLKDGNTRREFAPVVENSKNKVQSSEGDDTVNAMKPPRAAWDGFPDVLIHSGESEVKKHPQYQAAKSGDADAAGQLVSDTISEKQVDSLRSLLAERKPLLASVHAYEDTGVNAIPEAFADKLGAALDLPIDDRIVQTNVVGHTGADGFSRMARQALFDGEVTPNAEYVLVDDFVGQGGTLANLKGYIESNGGRVIAAVALTGKPYSAKLAIDQAQLQELRQKHGNLEQWWQERFGHSFDRLTQSEARYLTRSPDVDTIRNKITATEQAGNSSQAQDSIKQNPRQNAGDETHTLASSTPKEPSSSPKESSNPKSTSGVGAESKAKVTDAGEELTYNKRNRIKSGIKWADVQEKNDALKAKEVQKGNVYPKPDYEALVADGMEPVVAHIVKQVYDSISAKPSVRGIATDLHFQTYITAVNRVMSGVLKWANDKDAVRAWVEKQAKTAGAMMGKPTSLSDLTGVTSLYDSVYPGGWREFGNEISIVGDNKVLKALQPGYAETRRAFKDISLGWPAKTEAWQRQGYKIIPSDGFAIKEVPQGGDRGSVFFVRKSTGAGHYQYVDAAHFYSRKEAQAFLDGLKPSLLFNKRNRLVDSYDSREQAVDAARSAVKKEGGGETIEERGMNVADAERTGPERREEGEDVTAEQLRDVIGFKGVNFGNWVPNDERQMHLNHAYDSFLDLADVLNLPPRALSLDGMLGLAIGAQGSGSYAAHFVPGVNEINITRTMGAGSMAHEWAHALDHYFAAQAGFAAAETPWMTVLKRNSEKGEVRPEIIKAFSNIVQSMKQREATPDEVEARAKSLEASSRKKLESWLKYFEKEFSRSETAAAEFSVLADRIRKGDYQRGEDAYVTIVPARGHSLGTSVLSIVADVRDLAKKYKIKIPTDSIKSLDSNVSFVKYLEEKKDDDHKPQMAVTRYQAAANKLDAAKKGKKLYWSTPLEMFARAFDAYVSDKLKAKAQANSYLSHTDRQGDTVPVGDERTTINAAFDTLIGDLKTRETDRGIALFALATSDQMSGPSGLKATEAQAWAKTLPISKRVNIVQSVDDLPANARAEIDKAGVNPNRVQAMELHGTIHVIADHVPDLRRIKALVIGHELAHAGQSTKIVDLAVDWFKRTKDGKSEQAKAAHDLLRTVAKSYGFDLTNEKHFRLAVQEATAAYAEQAADGKLPTAGLIQQLFIRIKYWLRKNGLINHVSDSELSLAVSEMLRIGEKRLSTGMGGEQAMFAAAWHGSPYDHDKFRTDMIGSGEGAQAYGYGLYFAGNKAVAEYYREKLARGPVDVMFDGHPIKGKNQIENAALAEFSIYGDANEALDAIQDRMGIPGAEGDAFLEDVADYLRENKDRLSLKAPGALFHVELAPAEDEYLLWDKPLSEQSDKVKAVINGAAAKTTTSGMNPSGPIARLLKNVKRGEFKGNALYESLKEFTGSDQQTSDYLHSLGIRGIKYLDGSSRGKGDGNYNYVIFNDADVEIKAKFALRDQVSAVTEAIPGMVDYAKSNWISIVNPLDFSRTARWFDNWTPDTIKAGLGWFWGNPHFEAIRDAAKKVFVDEGSDREVNRMSLMLQFFGYKPGVGDARTRFDKLKDFVTKWHSGAESTDWEKLNQRYSKMTKEQQAAMDILTVQGDVNNTYYSSHQTAMLNRKIREAKLTEETFNLYRDVYDHMKLVAKIREQQIEHMLLEAGKSKAEIAAKIADYRNETREVAGWMTRNHGEGNHVVAVHHIVKDLKFTVRDITGEGQQAFLPFYPGKEVMAEVRRIAGEIGAKVTLTGKGAVVVTSANGEKLDAFIAEVGEIIPRIGQQRVMVYSRRHNIKGLAAKHSGLVEKDLKKYMPENYRPGEEYITRVLQADTIPEELFQNMPNDIALEAGLEKAIEAALKHGEISSDEMEVLKSKLIQDTAEVLLGRAAGKYQIRRAPYLIEGYDTENVMSGYQDYMTGVAGMLSKAQYANRQFKHLTEAEVPVKPWAYKYVFDSLRNQGMGDRISANARAFVSLMYLALKPSSALINATQIWTLGVAEIGRIIDRGSAVVLIGKAQKDALGDKLTLDERQIFDSAIMYQQEAATALSQITGHNEGTTGKWSRLLNNITGKGMAIFQNIEVLNRKTIILAAYRVLRDKNLPAGVIDKAALKQALDINNNVNFDQGRHNLPGWARKPLGHTLYALKSFAWNNINWIYTRATSGERRDMIALLRYTGMVMLIGGASALAGGDELDKLYRKLRGKSLLLEAKEWTHKNSQKYGSLGEMASAFAWHGMAGMFGVNISNSMRLQIPVASEMLGDATLPEAIGGVWVGLAKKAWLTGVNLSRGDAYRAVESAAPEALAGGMRAYRQYDRGMTTLKGRPVFDENGQPLKYSASDAVLRAAGFQPGEQSRRMEVTMVGKELVAWWKDERDDLLAALRISKPGEDRKEVMRKVLRFNRDIRQSQAWGKVGVIDNPTITRALTYKPNKKDVAWQQEHLN